MTSSNAANNVTDLPPSPQAQIRQMFLEMQEAPPQIDGDIIHDLLFAQTDSEVRAVFEGIAPDTAP